MEKVVDLIGDSAYHRIINRETEDMTEPNHAIRNAQAWLQNIRTLVLKLNDDGLTDEQRDAAREEIEEAPLSVQVRDGWRSPSSEPTAGEPEEYEILLSTGGPALRIYGNLDQHNQPDEWPKLQWQDWGVPWTDYPLGEEREAVQQFASVFYFGE